MFREMRRFKQQLAMAECENILARGTSGVLALNGDGGYPYAVPMSYVYDNGKIIFHSAREGHKYDAVLKSDRASFCVIDEDNVVPEKYTTYFRSVIAFGKIRILEDDVQKREAIRILAEKYSPLDPDGRMKEIDREFGRLCMLELQIEHMTGKEAIELVKAKK